MSRDSKIKTMVVVQQQAGVETHLEEAQLLVSSNLETAFFGSRDE